MTSAVPTSPPLRAAGLIREGVRGLARNASRLGISWDLLRATVTDGTDPMATKVVCDGDVKPITVLSMIGVLPVYQRVYLLQTPPSGLFICGYVGNPLAQVGGLVAWSQETTDSAGFTGATPREIGSVSALLIENYMYEVTCGVQLVSNGTDNYQGTMWQDQTNINANIMAAGRMSSTTFDNTRPNIIPLRAMYTATITGRKKFTVSGHIDNGGGGTWNRNASVNFPQLFTVTLAHPGILPMSF